MQSEKAVYAVNQATGFIDLLEAGKMRFPKNVVDLHQWDIFSRQFFRDVFKSVICRGAMVPKRSTWLLEKVCQKRPRNIEDCERSTGRNVSTVAVH